jgi:hypothetical protein
MSWSTVLAGLRGGPFLFSAKKYIPTRVAHAAPRVGCSEGKHVYFVRGMDASNIALDTEQFETMEEALKQACTIEKTGLSSNCLRMTILHP